MLISPLAVLVLIAGGLLFGASTTEKPKEFGRLMFFAGLLASLWVAGARTIHLL